MFSADGRWPKGFGPVFSADGHWPRGFVPGFSADGHWPGVCHPAFSRIFRGLTRRGAPRADFPWSGALVSARARILRSLGAGERRGADSQRIEALSGVAGGFSGDRSVRGSILSRPATEPGFPRKWGLLSAGRA